MRVLHLIAGAGGMYCGSCISGNALVRALREAGIETFLLPLYSPLRTDEPNQSEPQVALGGVNLYLALRFPRLRLPRFVRRWLDHPAVLSWAGRRGETTNPESLGPMCEAMLEGRFASDHRLFDEAIDWIRSEARPDVIHLNNALLLGLAPCLKARLGVPVVASLSGEDVFWRRLPEPYQRRTKDLLRLRCGECDGLAAMNGFYAGFFAREIGIELEGIEVIPPGISVELFAPSAMASSGGGPCRPAPRQRVIIGFLSRICREKGLHTLIEAAGKILARTSRTNDSADWRIECAGYLSRSERAYWEQCLRQVAELGLADRFVHRGELDLSGKAAFLQNLDIFCLPSVIPESKGLPVFEAWAAGVPAVLPAHGAFVEMVEASGGGLLFHPNDADALADCLARLISDAGLRQHHGRNAREWVRRNHTLSAWAGRTIAWYHRVLSRYHAGRSSSTTG